MRSRRTVLVLIAVMICLLAGPMLPAQTKPTDVAVIVNPQNSIDSISSTDLRKIFSGEKRSWNGSLPVFLIVRDAPAHERDVLLSQILKMNESEYKQYWVKKVYSGEVLHEPLAVPSNGFELEAVRSEKGAIALISLADVKQGVKVLKIDGHMPGTAGYPLK
jgi:ABC-type phosphate transport system substrate-binding protein